jgi:osmotically-inducible protein OsmY
MDPAQMMQADHNELSRCEDAGQINMEEKDPSRETIKADAALAREVDAALSKESAFKAIDYNSIDVRVNGGIVHLYGHVSSLANQHRAERAVQNLPGLLGINNYLIPDDRLLAEVASALGALEHSYVCNFFTGVSHGVVFMSGNASDENVKLLAERCAAAIPNVRGVINTVRVSDDEPVLEDVPFLQPTIGEIIYFTNGNSGVVKQVIINPDNRCVIAMIIQGRFSDQRLELQYLNNDGTRSPEQLMTVPMNAVRYMTRVSGFLNISSSEKSRYSDFDPAAFAVPNLDWVPPYPYCPGNILFPGNYQDAKPIVFGPEQLQFAEIPKDATFVDQFFANDSLGI